VELYKRSFCYQIQVIWNTKQIIREKCREYQEIKLPLQPAQFADSETGVLGLPVVVSGAAHPVLPAKSNGKRLKPLTEFWKKE
jgi:hypothetical protein